MIAKNLIPAVSYVRMSSNRQEESPDQQRAAIAKLAEAHGCKLIREYYEPGVSGDATEKRVEFQRMIRDAEEKGDFAAILCWDQDRFGRFDSLEAGRWIHPLRTAGVWLLTVAQGRIDWNNFQSRMLYSIIQEGKHQYLIDLSRNVLRGRIAAAKAGRLMVPPSYAYDRLFFDLEGKLARQVPYGEKFTRPKGWTVKLTPTSNTEQIETVRWLFDTFANTDCSLRSLVLELNRRGVPTRRGKRWSAAAIRYILTNPVYLGWSVFGKRRGGKYHQIGDDGDLTENRKKCWRRPPIVVKGTHEPLIDEGQFNLVQAKLAERTRRKAKPRDNGYILTGGVLKCGHCGRNLCGKPGSAKTKHRYYYCPGLDSGQCTYHAVRQDEIDGLVFGILEERLFSPKAIDAITAAIFRRLKDREGTKKDVDGLKQKADALDRKITRGTENLLLADPQHVPALSTLLANLKDDRAKIQAELEQIATEPNGENAAAVAERAVKELKRLRSHLKSGNPLRVRAIVKSMVDEITLWWDREIRGRKYPRGVLTLRSPDVVLESTHTRSLQIHIVFDWLDMPGKRPQFVKVVKIVREVNQATGTPVRASDVAQRLGIGKEYGNAGRALKQAEAEGWVKRVGRSSWLPVSQNVVK